MLYRGMTPRFPSCAARLSKDLMAEVERLARCERDVTVQLISHLAERIAEYSAAKQKKRRTRKTKA